MAFATIPGFVGVLGMAFIGTSASTKVLVFFPFQSRYTNPLTVDKMGNVLHDCEMPSNIIYHCFNKYLRQAPFLLSLFLGLSLIPSNLPGRTKRTVTSFTFVFVPLSFDGQCSTDSL